MTEALLNDHGVPSLYRLFGEGVAIMRRPFLGDAVRRVAAAHRGDGRTVLVIPGFLAHDLLTRRLRTALDEAGYVSAGWQLGQNLGVRGDLLDRLETRLDELYEESGRPVAVVGWSLGGIYAREMAKRLPHAVDRVVSLASPFSGDPRANRAWKLYERINGYPVDQPPIEVSIGVKPPVPSYALWTPNDGVVAPGCARGQADESDHQIAVDCRHMDFVSSPAGIAAVLSALVH